MRNLFNKLSGVAIATAFLLGSTASWADPIAITNPSFEDPSYSDGGYANGVIPGWDFDQTDGVVGVWNPSHVQTGCGVTDQFLDQIPDGVQVAYSNGGGDLSANWHGDHRGPSLHSDGGRWWPL